MSNMKFAYQNQWGNGTLTETSYHISFPVEKSSERRLTSPWRSAYGSASGGGFFEITASNRNLYFDEGGGSLTAPISIGTYNALTLAAEIEIQMEAAGAHSYTISYDYDAFKFEIEDDTGTVSLLGSNNTNAIWDTIGFNIVDTGFAASHTADYIRIHTYEYITDSLTAADNFDLCAIFNHNIQSTGILKLQFSNDNFATTPLELTPARNGNLAVSLLNATQSYQYRRIYIEDKDNPDGYVEIGLYWIDEVFSPTIGFAPGFTENPVDKSIVNESIDGAATSVQYPHLERKNYKSDLINPFSPYQTIFDEIGKSKSLIMISRELLSTSISFDNPELYTTYCRLKSWNKTHIGGEGYKLSFSIQEEN